MDHRLKHTCKTINILLENNKRKSLGSRARQRVLELYTKSTMNKEKTDKSEDTKVKKNFCPVRDSFKRMKRRITDWEKIFTKHIADKELVSRRYKGFSKHR